MDVRQSIHSAHAKTLDTQGLRSEFLVEQVFEADKYTMVYSHIDRIIVGGIMPVAKTVSVGGEVGKQLGVSYFLERRELGVINIGGPGTITVDGKCYEIGHRDALYVGKGAKEVVFASIDGSKPAKFYYNCAPAHTTYPTKKVTPADVAPVTLGDNLTSNRRTINKYCSGCAGNLSAQHGADRACAGQPVEHHAVPYPRAPHGGLLLFQHG